MSSAIRSKGTSKSPKNATISVVMPPGEKSNKAVMRSRSCFAFHFVSGLNSRLHSKYVHVQPRLLSVLGVRDLSLSLLFLLAIKQALLLSLTAWGLETKLGQTVEGTIYEMSLETHSLNLYLTVLKIAIFQMHLSSYFSRHFVQIE